MGFCDVDVVASPKFQLQEVGKLLEVSVNATTKPEMLLAKEATGFMSYFLNVSINLTNSSVEVNFWAAFNFFLAIPNLGNMSSNSSKS